jgi:hypothetical protein
VDAKRWLRELRAELGRRKLPPLYVERFVGELSDHVNDVLEDPMSTDAKDLHGVFDRLGAPRRVADAAAREYRQARFSGRHPVLVFVVLPILALPVLWAAAIVALVAAIKLLGLESGRVVTSEAAWRWADAVVPYVVVGLMVIPIALAAAFFCRLAARSAVSWKWCLIACVLLAVIGGMAMAQFALPTDTSRGTLRFGFGVQMRPSASQMLQFLLPLAIGGWAIWRQTKGGSKVGRAHA